MSDTLTGPSPLAEPSHRGRLVIKDQVIATIAERAAVAIPSVLPMSAPLNPLSRSLPRAEVIQTPTHARITVRLATAYDRPLYAVAAQVRDHVTETVTRLTGLTVDIVSVEIASVVGDPDRVATSAPTPARKELS